ncbi:MAG TPA: hypothetical protein VEB88_05155 [Candidatus Acidoferrales bacterium]|nr:hypothetical protein [Candidatus Acidoferrales bacterium]
MPFADPQRRREYDKERKQKQRAEGRTKKRLDTRLTALEIKNAKDLCSIINEVVDEARNADTGSLELAAKLRIKLRAVEIGLRVIEITNHEQRIAALEEQSK